MARGSGRSYKMADREHSADMDEWNAIIALTKAMRDHADQGEWEEVARLQSERHASLARIFSHPVSPEESAAVEENIRQVLAADAEILALGGTARTNTSGALSLLRNRMKAHSAYTRAGRS